ncbi:MAG: hypothetical protein IJ673_11040, partial [Treponema sp.]|nr:hypothetical protein [Treponema sp.]
QPEGGDGTRAEALGRVVGVVNTKIPANHGQKVHDAPGFFLFSMKNLLQAIQKLNYLFLDFTFHVCN